MSTILVVDDRIIDRRFLVLLLEYHDHCVLEAANGEQALKIVRSALPDLVITDILMPEQGGYQLVLRLRAEPGIVLPRVIFRATAEMVDEARGLARVCGVADVVTRFAEPEAVLAMVNAAIAAASPLAAGAPLPDPSVINEKLSIMATALYRRLTEVESQHAQFDQRATEGAAQLELARSALEQEIGKRLLAETELTQASHRLRTQAIRDPLTGLFNRRYLEESLKREEGRARRNQQPLGVMMIDIDHFKRFNDTFGHAAGDEVLRAVSGYMQSLTRAEDILCRYGGEEFMWLMANATPTALMDRAELLLSGARTLRIVFNGKEIGPLTLSVGIALFPEHGDHLSAAMEAADAALYRAKQAGRDRVMAARSEPLVAIPI
jgi:diguanylate cyclase (GGDEF)-like protein